MNYRKNILIVMLTSFLFNACKSNSSEKASLVAKKYCNCLEQQLNLNIDSTIDISDCETKIFKESRLMTIYQDFDNQNSFTKETIDSAKNFALEVRDSIDKICFWKLDPKRIKKRQHL